MAKRRKQTLSELLADKLSFIKGKEESFLDGLESTEKALFGKLLAILKRFTQKNGTLVQDESSSALLLRLKKEINQVIGKSGLNGKLKNFLVSFDKVEDMNRTIYSRVIGRPVKTGFTLERAILVDEIADRLGQPLQITNAITNPIRNVLASSIHGGMTFTEAEENLKRLVVGGKSGGLIKKYAGQVAKDAINGFDGAINDKIRDEFELDGFRYVGSLIATSRTNCIEWINGTGKFKKYAIRPGTYRVADLKAMIAIAKKRPGFNQSTNPKNFGQLRGGYRCGHQVFYFRLTPEQDEQVNEQISKSK